MTALREAGATFACFGSTCSVHVQGSGPAGAPADAVRAARRRLLDWHAQFTRFEATSELTRLNTDPRPTVAVSPVMARFVDAAIRAAEASGGLVDATLLDELEEAGYAEDLVAVGAPAAAGPHRGPLVPAGPRPEARWRAIEVDRDACTVTRPPGVRLDTGGIAKGLFADLLAGVLAGHDVFGIDCAGDLRIGGRAGRPREIQVQSPFDDAIVHAFELTAAGIATSGIRRRSWTGSGGAAAHHLIDPATGSPAFTGVVQATAVAPSAVEAEMRAKAALLSGPAGGPDWLVHGGVLVLEDGSVTVV